jgi:cytochrome c553
MGDAEIEALAVDYSVLRCGGGATGAAPMPLIANRCAACHGAKGVSPLGTVPNLAGQKQSYLVKQLAYFRDAARGLGFGDKESRYNAMMDSQGRRLDDMNLYALARYYAKLPCR